jgi:hypothetical protein
MFQLAGSVEVIVRGMTLADARNAIGAVSVPLKCTALSRPRI